MSAIRYRPEIDGLRCIAVLAVILFHAGFTPFSGGFIGVDIFFVISGYLITRIIQTEIAQQRFSFARFYERRVRRIFPALFVMAVATSVAALLLLAPDQLQQYGRSLVAMSLFLSNRFFYQQTGYFAPNVDELPLLHTWSLSVEEQFYLVFPLFLIALARWAPQRVRGALAGVLLLSFALCVYREQTGKLDLGFFSTPSRIWELLLGCWLATHVARHGAARVRAAGAWAAVGLLMTMVPVFAFGPTTGYPGWLTAIPVAGTALLLRHADASNAVGKLLGLRPLVAVGLVSYSAYLWHQPVFAMALHATGQHAAVGVQLALIGLTLGLSYLSWRFVERPMRSPALVTTRRIWTGAGLGSAALVTAGLVANLGDGLPGRFDLDFSPFRAIDLPVQEQHCRTLFPGFEANCLASPTVEAGKAIDYLVLGDSHAQAFAAGLVARHPALRVVAIGRDGCPPFDGVERYDVNEKIPCEQAAEQLARHPIAATHTILIARYAYYEQGSGFGWADTAGRRPRSIHIQPQGHAERSDAATYATVLADGLEATLQRLRAAGSTRVFVLLQPPELGFDPRNCLAFGLRVRKAGACTIARDAVQMRQQGYRRAMEPVLARHPEVTVVDPMHVLCAAESCTATASGKMLYRDDDHLSLDGAALVFDRLF
ncbi:acyltransferase family protein [Comamonadaceae bacterium G21597-S1]|nr:acyltransferase family protein [Comamonadaceae bacterium G21597-S1]